MITIATRNCAEKADQPIAHFAGAQMVTVVKQAIRKVYEGTGPGLTQPVADPIDADLLDFIRN